MPFTANVIRVLIASPSDLIEERKVAITTVYEWNAQHAEAESVVLLPVAWETHVTPRSGVRPQATINEQLVDQSDILVGMFWTKLGTSTGVAPCGTVEEIERFISAGKPALLYFSQRPIDPASVNPKQNRRLREFKDSIYKTAVVGSFDSLKTLQEAVARHLLAEVRLLNRTNAKAVVTTATVTANATAPENAVSTKDTLPLDQPNDNWDREAFERAVFFSIYGKDDEQFARIDTAYQKSADYHEGDNAATWRAFIEWARIQFGTGGQLKNLKKLAEDNPESERTLIYLGRAYARFDQHQNAAETFLSAMQQAESQDKKAKHASEAIIQFHEAGDEERSRETLAELRGLVASQPSLESVLVETVRDLAEAEKDAQFIIALLERHMELNPDDYAARFKLAFKQSEEDNNAVALRHYYKIPPSERLAMTWNNIGAAADQLGLPVKAVAAYNRAVALDETLSMSNLGTKLLNSGFLELAQEQCSNALKASKPHPNVGSLVTSLASVEEEERERQDQILAGVEARVSFLQQLGKAATLASPERIAENWQGPDCTFKCERRNGLITLRGTYEREDNLLAGLLGSPGALSAASRQPSKRKHSITYSGRIRGLAVVGEAKYDREGSSLLGSAGEQKAFMILSEDGSEFSIFEKTGATDPTIKILKRIQVAD